MHLFREYLNSVALNSKNEKWLFYIFPIDIKFIFSLLWLLRGFWPSSCVICIVLENLPSSPQRGSGLGLASRLPSSFSPINTCLLGPHFLQREEYHTHLAVLYLDQVLQQGPSANSMGTEVTEAQVKLRHLLQKSDVYRVRFLMGKEYLHW